MVRQPALSARSKQPSGGGPSANLKEISRKISAAQSPPASHASHQRLNIRTMFIATHTAFYSRRCLGRFRRTTTMSISFFSPHQTEFSETHHATTQSVTAQPRVTGLQRRGRRSSGRLRAANACDHCSGRFGMVTHRCWGSKFCKKTCKASFLRGFWGNRNLPLLRLRPQNFGVRLPVECSAPIFMEL